MCLCTAVCWRSHVIVVHTFVYLASAHHGAIAYPCACVIVQGFTDPLHTHVHVLLYRDSLILCIEPEGNILLTLPSITDSKCVCVCVCVCDVCMCMCDVHMCIVMCVCV